MDVHLRTLLIVLLLTAAATAAALHLPATEGMDTFGLVLDLVPFAGAVIATGMMVLRLRLARVPWISVLIAGYTCSAFALVSMLGTAHLVAVIDKAMNTSGEFAYDFHFYSLIQLGGSLVLGGFFGALQAPLLARGQRPAWTISLVIWSVLLLINVPLIPLQGFAVLFSVLAALGVAVLYGARFFQRDLSEFKAHQRPQGEELETDPDH